MTIFVAFFFFFIPQKRNKYFVEVLKFSKSGRKTCFFFLKIGEMEKLKIEWKALDLFDCICVLFKFKFIFINIYFKSNFFHFIKRLDRRYKMFLPSLLLLLKISVSKV